MINTKLTYLISELLTRRMVVLLVLMKSSCIGFTQLPLLHIDQPYELYQYQGNENFEMLWHQKGQVKMKFTCTFNEQGYVEDWIRKKYDKKAKEYVTELEIHKEYIYNELNKPIEVFIAQKLFQENNVLNTFFVDSLSYNSNTIDISHMDTSRHIFSLSRVSYSKGPYGNKVEVKTGTCTDCLYNAQVYHFNNDGGLIKYNRVEGSGTVKYFLIRQDMEFVSKEKVISKVSRENYNSRNSKSEYSQKRVYRFREDGTIKKCTIKSLNNEGRGRKLVIRININ